jgi:hypothetical protein
VVDREFIEPTCFLGLCVDIGIGAAHEPKHGGNVPLFRTIRNPHWPAPVRLPDTLGGEVPTKRVDHALGCRPVIPATAARGDRVGCFESAFLA